MTTTILKAPVCKMQNLDNLFIEMTAKNCNQRCKHCYIDFPITKNVKDFIPMEFVQKALKDTSDNIIKCIYLTGAEPMTHPDFNKILRLCLAKTNVCIATNGTFINEKKARFLRKVEDESNNEIIFILSLAHYEENKNDNIRSRGSYRQVIHAIKHLTRYGFNPFLSIMNYYNEPTEILNNNIKDIMNNIGYDINKNCIQINEYHDKSVIPDTTPDTKNINCDCKNGRVLTTNGIYSCLFLANDYRGRCGSDFTDYSKKTILETPYCNTCLKNSRQVFGINLSNFTD